MDRRQEFRAGGPNSRRSWKPNSGILIDPIHFDRGGSRPDEIDSVPQDWLRYAQLCDAPAERPVDAQGLLLQARAERLMPGDGGIDLLGILRALPRKIPLSVEAPMQTLARTAACSPRRAHCCGARKPSIRSRLRVGI
jgi:sugar phosphate isomerase/epimerase